MEMKKSKFASEKARLMAIALALLALGVTVLTNASTHISCTPQFAIEVVFGLLMLTIGYVLLKLREYLKLNRWSHAIVVPDNTVLQKIIKRLEGEQK